MLINILTSRWIKGLAIGTIAGFGGGLISLGGGTLVIPLLMSWLYLTPLQARGSAILLSVFSAASGSLLYGLRGQVDFEIVLWVAIPSFVITPIAAIWSEKFSAQRLKQIFGVVIMFGGLLVIFRHQLPAHWIISNNGFYAYLLAIGILEGLVAGVVGISGGPVLTPLFVIGLGLPQQLAQGCSLAARLPATISGSWENWKLGNIVQPLILPLAAGALVGTLLGGHLALSVSESSLRTFFGSILIVLGVHYLVKRNSV